MKSPEQPSATPQSQEAAQQSSAHLQTFITFANAQRTAAGTPTVQSPEALHHLLDLSASVRAQCPASFWRPTDRD